MLTMNVNGDKAFLLSNIHEWLCIPARVVRLWLIGNYTCGSESMWGGWGGGRGGWLIENQTGKIEKCPTSSS